MTALATIIKDLEDLPEDKLEEAARYVHSLKDGIPNNRAVLLQRAFSGLDSKEVDEWEESIKQCRKIDVESW